MDISSVFQQTELSVHVPLLPGPFQVPTDEQDKAAWFERLVATSAERESCFYGQSFSTLKVWINLVHVYLQNDSDEKLLYLCKLEFRANAMTRPGWQEAVEHIAKSIKVSVSIAPNIFKSSNVLLHTDQYNLCFHCIITSTSAGPSTKRQKTLCFTFTTKS